MPRRKHQVPQGFIDELHEMWDRVNQWNPPIEGFKKPWNRERSAGAYEALSVVCSRVVARKRKRVRRG